MRKIGRFIGRMLGMYHEGCEWHCDGQCAPWSTGY